MQDIRKDDCIFCKLAAGDIPSITCYEDELFRVFCDVSPATKGHLLVVTKNHYENFFEIPDEIVEKIFVLAKKAAAAVMELTGCDGLNVLQNNGKTAGQTVFHYHIHIIPRYDKGEDMLFWKTHEVDKEAMEAIADEIQNRLSDS